MRSQLVTNALSIWAENIDVSTLRGRQRISEFFTENQSSKGAKYWAKHLKADVSTGGIFDDSKRQGDRGQYCGLFIAYAGRGLILPDIRYFCLPSTNRMQSAAQWKKTGVKMPDGWELEKSTIQRGDIITVGSGKFYGTHLALVVERDDHILKTVEANTFGELGNGKSGRGVVRRRRTIKEVQRVYRFDHRHFIQGACA